MGAKALADALCGATAETLRADAEFARGRAEHTMFDENADRYRRLAALAIVVARMQEMSECPRGGGPSFPWWIVTPDGDATYSYTTEDKARGKSLPAALASVVETEDGA